MRIYQVDSFSARPFGGNPAGVCPLDEPAPEAWMQRVAAEVNVSETAFTHPLPDGSFRLRWFTPTTEVDLCGHATLATAHIIASAAEYPGRTRRPTKGELVRFATNSGELTARVDETGITLDFPATPVQECPTPPEASRAIGGGVLRSGTSRFDLLLELSNRSAVETVTPDFAVLSTLPYRGIIVTAAADADEDCDFVSRFFAPSVGVIEDPVTGSAHCALGPYWSARLNRDTLMGYQASTRGGYVRVRRHGDRVELHGNAVTVMAGELMAEVEPETRPQPPRGTS